MQFGTAHKCLRAGGQTLVAATDVCNEKEVSNQRDKACEVNRQTDTSANTVDH